MVMFLPAFFHVAFHGDLITFCVLYFERVQLLNCIKMGMHFQYSFYLFLMAT